MRVLGLNDSRRPTSCEKKVTPRKVTPSPVYNGNLYANGSLSLFRCLDKQHRVGYLGEMPTRLSLYCVKSREKVMGQMQWIWDLATWWCATSLIADKGKIKPKETQKTTKTQKVVLAIKSSPYPHTNKGLVCRLRFRIAGFLLSGHFHPAQEI